MRINVENYYCHMMKQQVMVRQRQQSCNTFNHLRNITFCSLEFVNYVIFTFSTFLFRFCVSLLIYIRVRYTYFTIFETYELICIYSYSC